MSSRPTVAAVGGSDAAGHRGRGGGLSFRRQRSEGVPDGGRLAHGGTCPCEMRLQGFGEEEVLEECFRRGGDDVPDAAR